MFELWQWIYNQLSGDSALTTLLGGTGKVQRSSQAKPSDFDKLVTYGGLTEVPDAVRPAERHPYLLVAFSKEGDKSADDIAERIIKILDGKSYTSGTAIQLLTCELISKQAPYWDEQQQAWRSDVRMAFRILKK